MKQHGINPGPECPLYSEYVSDFAALEGISLPSSHTVLLVAADARDVPANAVARIAERLLGAGLAYICVWGPDCERVHDIFDEVHVGDGSTEPGYTLMSTWHSTESLDEAIWFFVKCAFPLDDEIKSTSYLAVTVGNKAWADTVDAALSDVSAFTSRMLTVEKE